MGTDTKEADLEQLIRRAFPEGPPPGAGDITVSWELDASVYDGKRWADVHPMLLNPSVWALTKSAFLYYLPAYLLAPLRYDWFDTGPLLDLLYTPDTPSESWLPEDRWREKRSRWQDLVGSLTQEQKHVIKLWLENLERGHPYDQGETSENPVGKKLESMLRDYWSQF